jgi:hypothetical protein
MSKIKEVLKFMETEEYVGMSFKDFIKKFNLTDEEFIYVLEIHTEEAPLKLVRENDDIYVI